jgi:hypothetical protein
MPLPEHRVLGHDRNQDLGEPCAQPLGVELPPATRVDLLDPELWARRAGQVRPRHERRGRLSVQRTSLRQYLSSARRLFVSAPFLFVTACIG